MTVFEVDSTIKASPEAAFDAMADARNEPRWNSQVSGCSLATSEPIGHGSRFETVNRGRTYQAEITTFDRPNQLTFEVTGKGMDITATFAFTADGEGTANHATFDFRPKGFLRVMFPLMKPLVAKDGPKQAANFAAFVEGRSASV
jgi:uncharacterized protein YndB with AHSA1/START domain